MQPPVYFPHQSSERLRELVHARMTGDHNTTVWVVDQEPVIASTLAMILKIDGYRAVTLSGPDEALRAAAKEVPDVLIADVVLPDLDGIDLAVKLQAMHPGCRVLLLSAQANTSEALWQAAKGRGRGFELMAKPLHPKVLLEMVQRLSKSDVPELLN